MERDFFETMLPLKKKSDMIDKEGGDADLLNDETFGVGDSIADLNDDWEKRHETFSKILELEHEKVKKSSPMRIHNSVDTSNSSDSMYEKSQSHQAFINSSDEEEESIIGSSISQLCMDDDSDFIIRSGNHSKSYEFQESEESWNSPTRGANHKSNSLQELISPGEGVWASPSRSELADRIVPQIDLSEKNYEGEDLMKKLFCGNRDVMMQANKTPDAPKAKAIHLEDLERGLPSSPSPNIGPSKDNATPVPPGFLPMGMLHQSPHIGLGTPGIPMSPMGGDGKIPSPAAVMNPLQVDMASLLLLNKQAMQLHGTPPPTIPVFPPLLSPQYFAAAAHHARLATPDSFVRQSPRNNSRWKTNRKNLYSKKNFSEKTWHRYPKQVNADMHEQQEFMAMKPSKMMTAKEKEWIFKISLMSLLSGDPNITDYYFVSYMNKKMLEKAKNEDETKAANEETIDNLEKTKKLMTYAQKNQQAKESYKPVKFEGSLGKLSITSVHHPRQIMDVASEGDYVLRGCETKKKRFVFYGIVEKLYDLLLNIQDVEHRFLEASSEEQEHILKERNQDINKMFQLFKIKLHTLEEDIETDHFLQLMTIAKARKFLSRSFSLFFPIQSESILLVLLQILPTLLKKDMKENALKNLPEKVDDMLKKCSNTYKIKCSQLLLTLNWKSILFYPFGCSLTAVILESLMQVSSPSNECERLKREIPKEIFGLSEDVKTRNKKELNEILLALHSDGGLINKE